MQKQNHSTRMGNNVSFDFKIMQSARSDYDTTSTKTCNETGVTIPLQEFYQLIRMVSRIEARVNQITVFIFIFGLLICMRLKPARINDHVQFGQQPPFLLELLERTLEDLQIAKGKVVHLQSQLQEKEKSGLQTIVGQMKQNGMTAENTDATTTAENKDEKDIKYS